MKKALSILLLSVFILLSCSEKRSEEASMSYNGNEILVKNFPRPTQGTGSLFGESFGSFSFDDLDRYVYKIAKSSSQNTIFVAIQFKETDSYGNTSLGEKITIGSVDVNDSKNFADFDYWKRKYGTYRMWNKDREEYDRTQRQDNQGGFRIIPTYKPKSIR